MSETTPPSAPSPIRPSLRLVTENDLVEVSVEGVPTADVASLACEALHELLPADTRRREHIEFAVDDVFSWILGWREDLLIVTIIDEAGAPWSPPTTVTPGGFIDALYRADLGQSARTLRALERIRRWIGALRDGDAAPDPKGGVPTVGEPPQPGERDISAAAPLSAGALRHLAYREDWASFFHGTIAVFPKSDQVQVFDRDGLHVLDRQSGDEIALQPSLYPAGAPGLALDADARLTAFDARGRIRWRSIPTVEGSPKHTVVTDEILLIEEEHATLSAYDTATGHLRWRHRAFHGGGMKPLVTGDLVWRLANDGFLYGVWASSGEAYCRRRVLGRPAAALKRTNQGVVTFTAVEDAVQLAQFDAHRGEPTWLRRVRGRLVAEPVTYPGGCAMIIERDGRQVLHELDETDGSQRSHHLLDDAAEAVRLDALDGLLLTKSSSGAVLGFAQAGGGLLWRLGPDIPHHAPWARLGPISSRGLLLCAGASIRAVDPHTGRLIQTLDCAEFTPAWVSAWGNGDLMIIEDDVLHLFRLHGHLSLVPTS